MAHQTYASPARFGLALALTLLITTPVSAQTPDPYPTRPIKVIVGIGAGSNTDALGRLAASFLSKQLNQAVVVENRPGAGGTIAAEAVASAAPDGYTILWASSSIPMFPHMYSNLKFDPIKDLVGVGGVAEGGLVILTRPDAPWKTLAEMIQYGKGKPAGAISYASAGIGSNAYLFSEIFAQTVGLEFLHVPYKGSSAALADIVSGQVDFVFDGPSTAIPQVDSGRVRALAFSTKNRSSFMPNTPTLNEAGATGFGQRTWLAFFAPAGTPSAITKKLSDSIGAFVPTPAFRKELGGLAHEPMPMTGEALTSMIKEEAVQWGVTLKSLKLQPSK